MFPKWTTVGIWLKTRYIACLVLSDEPRSRLRLTRVLGGGQVKVLFAFEGIGVVGGVRRVMVV